MSLVSMKVYYQYCPDIVRNLSHFPATVAGEDVASLIPVEGKCVRNAVKVGNETELSKCHQTNYILLGLKLWFDI